MQPLITNQRPVHQSRAWRDYESKLPYLAQILIQTLQILLSARTASSEGLRRQ